MGQIFDYKWVKFKLGNNIECKVESDNFIGGTWFYHKIAYITGYGDMYSDSALFQSIEANPDGDVSHTVPEFDITWQQFIENTHNFYSQHGISQGFLDFTGITTIADGFGNGLYIEGITLDDNTTRIGDYAFSGQGSASYLCALEWPLIIPASVQYIGDYAFDFARRLKVITFKDNSFDLYTQAGINAFWVPVQMYTEVNYRGGTAREYDWLGQYNRIVNTFEDLWVYIDGHRYKLYKDLPVKRITDPSMLSIFKGDGYISGQEVKTKWGLSLHEITDEGTDYPLRIFINNKIYGVYRNTNISI